MESIMVGEFFDVSRTLTEWPLAGSPAGRGSYSTSPAATDKIADVAIGIQVESLADAGATHPVALIRCPET
jgi:hypothetical protein